MSKRAVVPVNVLAVNTEPSGQFSGDVYYNKTDSAMYVYTGTDWNAVSGGDIDGGTPTTNYTSNTVINGGTP